MNFCVCFQHDCQEFIALLLDSLHEQLNAEQSANEALTPPEESPHLIPQNNQPRGPDSADTPRPQPTASTSAFTGPMLNNQTLSEKIRLLQQQEDGGGGVDIKNNIEIGSIDTDSETTTLNSKSTSLSSVSTDNTIKLLHSEDSNQSGSSLQSNGDIHQSDSLLHREDSIPDQIHCFNTSVVEDVLNNVKPGSRDGFIDKDKDHDVIVNKAVDMPTGTTRKLPTLEDIYMKDNKVPF